MSETSLALAKQMLVVDYDTQDLLIQQLLNGAEEYVARVTGTQLATAAQIDYHNGGTLALWLNVRPVISITEVYDTEAAAIEPATSYVLRGNGIFRATSTYWDDLPINRWRVTYQGGYAAVPAGLSSIILQLLSRDFHGRGGKSAQAAAGYGTNWEMYVDTAMKKKLMAYKPGSAAFG